MGGFAAINPGSHVVNPAVAAAPKIPNLAGLFPAATNAAAKPAGGFRLPNGQVWTGHGAAPPGARWDANASAAPAGAAAGSPTWNGVGAPTNAGSVNRVQNDPNLMEDRNAYKARSSSSVMERDLGDINLAGADAAALAAVDAKGRMGQMGTLGSGAGATFVNKNITQPMAANTQKALAARVSQETARKDALAAGALPFDTANIAANQGAQQIGLQQQGQNWNQYFQTQQAQQAANNSALDRMMALYAPWLQGAAASGAAPPTMPGGF